VKYLEPAILAELRAVFDDVCGMLPQSHETQIQKSAIAERILKLAAQGERDPLRLRQAALLRMS
jgi:hypothetical protein